MSAHWSTPLIISIIALVISVFALVLAYFSWVSARLSRQRSAITRRNTKPSSAPANPPEDPVAKDGIEKPFVIYNPAKVEDVEDFRTRIKAAAKQFGAKSPQWLETTPDEPGTAQAVEAVKNGATLVLVAGGDGTLREVAGGLANSGVSLGILPAGTGNLYASNLGLPTDDFDECLTIAFTGKSHQADLCWLKMADVDRSSAHSSPHPNGAKAQSLPVAAELLPDPGEYSFMVMAGMGIDAKMMHSTSDGLKQRIGWWAYVAAGFKSLRYRRMSAEITLGGQTKSTAVQARTVLFANCGLVGAGLDLIPQASPDDGWMDIATIDTAGGILGWAELFGRVRMQDVGITPLGSGLTSSIHVKRVRQATLKVAHRHYVQVDGDFLGIAREVSVRLDERALLVRTL